MVFSLGQLLYATVLFVNAIAILHEERFLARIGWSTSQAFQQQDRFGNDGGGPSIKARLVALISAVRTLLRFPLIALNILIIVYELILG
ncbi:Yos1-like protein [Hyaloraphidium curvatum]|nr:Yos1-like protein [Hyaloraphidium curvatum]